MVLIMGSHKAPLWIWRRGREKKKEAGGGKKGGWGLAGNTQAYGGR